MAKATATIAVIERPVIHGRPAPLNLMAATSHGVRLVWTVRRETTMRPAQMHTAEKT